MAEDDPKAILLRLVEAEGRESAAFRREMRGAVSELRADVGRIDEKLDRTIAVTDARLDEQRATLNALIPTRIAAVPPAAE